MGLQVWIDAYLDHLRVERCLASNTLEAYARDLNALAAHVGGDVEPSSIQQDALASLMVDNTRHGLGPRSTARQLSALRGFFRFLVRERAIVHDPTTVLERPRIVRKLPRVLSFDEVERLLAAPNEATERGCLHSAMLNLMYASGLRVSELCSLRMSDLDLQRGLVAVRGKGGKRRLVPIGEVALNCVSRYLQMRKHLLRGGADLRAVQAMLGHADLGTTEIYTNLCADDVTDAHKKSHPRA